MTQDVTKKSFIKSAVLGRCPKCQKTSMFQSILGLKPSCPTCGLSYEFADSGDGPAVFVMLLVGLILMIGVVVVEIKYAPSPWVHFALWTPLCLVLSVGLLRPFKSLFVTLQYRKEAGEGHLDVGE